MSKLSCVEMRLNQTEHKAKDVCEQVALVVYDVKRCKKEEGLVNNVIALMILPVLPLMFLIQFFQIIAL